MSDELEMLRQKRMRELMQQQTQQQMQQQMQEERIASEIKLILSQILTPEARERLGNIRLAKPEFARQVEVLLIQLYQSGQLPKKLSDEGFRGILKKMQGRRKETKITRT